VAAGSPISSRANRIMTPTTFSVGSRAHANKRLHLATSTPWHPDRLVWCPGRRLHGLPQSPGATELSKALTISRGCARCRRPRDASSVCANNATVQLICMRAQEARTVPAVVGGRPGRCGGLHGFITSCRACTIRRGQAEAEVQLLNRGDEGVMRFPHHESRRWRRVHVADGGECEIQR